MKKIFVLAVFALISSLALSANTRKQIKFVDENGAIRTDLTGVTVFTVDTETAASLYTSTTNTTAITNPMTTTSTNTGINATQGTVEFWSAANTYDMNATIGGTVFKFFDVATTDKQFTISRVQSPGRTVADPPSNNIWVATTGSDTTGNGSFGNPYATINYAFTQVTTTKNTVLTMPGTYTEYVIWPSVSGIRLKSALGDTTVHHEGPDGYGIEIVPTFSGEHFVATVEGITVSMGDELTGISINNVNHEHNTDANSLTVYLNDITITDDLTYTDKGLWVQHADPNAQIKVVISGGGETWNCPVEVACGRTDDFLSIKNQVLLGGLTTTGNYAAEVFIQGSGIKASRLTIDDDHKLTNVGCWYLTTDNPAVYTQLADAYATY